MLRNKTSLFVIGISFTINRTFITTYIHYQLNITSILNLLFWSNIGSTHAKPTIVNPQPTLWSGLATIAVASMLNPLLLINSPFCGLRL